MEKKNNVSQIIIIVLLAITIILGGFLTYKQYIAKDNDNSPCNCKKCQTTTDDKDDNLSFDVSKIVNKDNTYTYALDKNFEKVPFEYSKTDKGYYFCADSCKDIDGDFSLILGAEVFKGGPDMTANFEFLLTKTGELKFVHETADSNLEVGAVSDLKNVVKLYIVKLTSDREVSPEGMTVVAQTNDGQLYDLYSYVIKD